MMRPLSKLHICAAAVIVVILYFLYKQRSIGFGTAIHSAWKGTAHRFVIFGDDWSDTGTYRVPPPPYLKAAGRDPARGELWTETLCKELACNLIDNFATSVPKNQDSSSVGSLIDSDVHTAAMDGKDRDNNNSVLIDFKTQVQQFLAYEKAKYRVPQRLRPTDDWTVFTIFFGLWDLLEYSQLEKDFAMRAIDNSIAELFRQLDVLAEHSLGPIRIVLPQVIDTTFLPRFKPATSGPGAQFAQMQHQRLFLQTYWNAVLLRGAAHWQGGSIFVPDPNAVVMEHVRMKQLLSEGIVDASGAGNHISLFEDVEQPCVTTLSDGNATNLHAAPVEKCSDPYARLFWDDLHLGPSAHELVGKQAARLVRGNQTVNIDQTTHEMSGDHGSNVHEGERFNLKFPPDY